MYEFKGIKFIVNGEVLPFLTPFKERPVDIVRLFNSDKVVVWVNCTYKDMGRFLPKNNHHILELRALDGSGFSREEAEILAVEMESFGVLSRAVQRSLLFDRYKPTYKYLTTHDLSQPV